MIDFKRYHGLLIVGGGMLCAFVFCNILLNVMFGSDPAMFNDPEKKIAWVQLQTIGENVAGVEMQTRHHGNGGPEAFGVVLGQSTTLRGIDPTLLKKEVVPRQPWLLINGFGSSFIKLRLYAQTLTASKIQPDTIILGLHATMLVGQGAADLEEDETETSADDRAKKNEPSEYSWRPDRWLKDHNWVRNQRRNISHHTNIAFFEARLALHEQLDSGAVGLFQPSDRPWRPLGRRDVPDRRPEKYLKRQFNGWTRFGWFQAESYSTTGRHADAFRDLIADLDALGPKQIIIVNLPVSSSLRGWLPPESNDVFRELIDEVSVGRNILVIDLRDAMPDDAFSDYAHLNPAGREVFTHILAEKINELNNNR